jgi:hypothetical protein
VGERFDVPAKMGKILCTGQTGKREQTEKPFHAENLREKTKRRKKFGYCGLQWIATLTLVSNSKK